MRGTLTLQDLFITQMHTQTSPTKLLNNRHFILLSYKALEQETHCHRKTKRSGRTEAASGGGVMETLNTCRDLRRTWRGSRSC